jgi:6-phospho-beta-glucosidase
MKITVIGGGSTYTPELVNGFLRRAKDLKLTELCLMDNNSERLEIVGGFAQRMAVAHGAPFDVVLSQDQRASIAGASYVITQIRVGMMPARVADEYLGRRHGLIGQETTGVGGMAKALRTIPVLLRVARDIHETAPGALLVNFTNPSGLITEALQRYAPQVASVGLCNAALTTQMAIVELLRKLPGIRETFKDPLAPERTALNVLGLNHLTWYRGFQVDGQEVWQTVLEGYIKELRTVKDPEWEAKTIVDLGMIPNLYLQYFYSTNQKLAHQSNWPPSRGEQVMAIEKDLLLEYQKPELIEPPANLMLRGGAYYSTVATQLINAHANNLGEVHVVNTRHNNAVPGWPGDWVLEMPCRVDIKGIQPLAAEPLPLVCFNLLAQVKRYELLTVEAAVHGDRRSAYEALIANPLGPSVDQGQTVLEDILETNADYLPQFK